MVRKQNPTTPLADWAQTSGVWGLLSRWLPGAECRAGHLGAALTGRPHGVSAPPPPTTLWAGVFAPLAASSLVPDCAGAGGHPEPLQSSCPPGRVKRRQGPGNQGEGPAQLGACGAASGNGEGSGAGGGGSELSSQRAGLSRAVTAPAGSLHTGWHSGWRGTGFRGWRSR